MRNLLWSYGLSQFLDHSNEDAICSRFIGKLTASTIRHLWPGCNRPVRIADIGCGQASKAVLIAKYLHNQGIRTDWQLIEIDDRWTPGIRETLRHVPENNELTFDVRCPLSAETWLQSLETVPDITQFIHVPYDDESEEMVFTLTMNLVSRKSFVLIAAEHPESDLSLIRRRMWKLGYQNLPSQRTTSLAKRLRSAGLMVRSYVLRKKYLDIGNMGHISEVDWFWNLVFGNEHHVSDKSRLSELIETIGASGHIPSLRATLLNIPDFMIAVRQRP